MNCWNFPQTEFDSGGSCRRLEPNIALEILTSSTILVLLLASVISTSHRPRWHMARKNGFRRSPPSACELGYKEDECHSNKPSPKAVFSLCFRVLLWIRSLALAFEPTPSLRFSSILDDLPTPLCPRSLTEPRCQLHAFFRKCDANYTPRPAQTATPTTRAPPSVAIPHWYGMVSFRSGVGCPAAVGHVKRVVGKAGANSPAQR